MATTSPFLGLILPEDFDKVDIGVLTNDFAVVDGAIGGLNAAIDDIADAAAVKDDIANNLTTVEEGKILDARQGKVLNDAKLDKTSVYNGLDATASGRVLDARQGKALSEAVGTKASARATSVTLLTENWVVQTDETYNQTVAVSGMTANVAQTSAVVAPEPTRENAEIYGALGIRAVVQGNGTLTFNATDIPESDIVVNILVVTMEVSA